MVWNPILPDNYILGTQKYYKIFKTRSHSLWYYICFTYMLQPTNRNSEHFCCFIFSASWYLCSTVQAARLLIDLSFLAKQESRWGIQWFCKLSESCSFPPPTPTLICEQGSAVWSDVNIHQTPVWLWSACLSWQFWLIFRGKWNSLSLVPYRAPSVTGVQLVLGEWKLKPETILSSLKV